MSKHRKSIKSYKMKSKLRVGILVDSMQLEVWKDEIIKEIESSNYAEVVLFIKRKDPRPISNFKKLLKFRKSIVFVLLSKFDAFLSKRLIRKHKSAFKRINYESSSIPIIEVIPTITKYKDIIKDQDIEEICSYNLDVIFRFGFRILKGRILNEASSHGVWSYHHGDNKVNRGGPPCFWEVLEGWDETGAIVQRLSDSLDGGFVLAKTNIATYKYNIAENKNRLYWRASKLITRLLKDLYLNDSIHFYKSKKILNNDLGTYDNKLYKAPENLKGLLMVFKYFKILFLQILNVSMFKYQWFLLYKSNSNIENLSLRTLKRIESSKKLFWADPFIITEGNRDYIFVEEFNWRKMKGHISVIENNENDIIKVTKVIDNNYHFSYPFIFSFKNNYYMIPETSKNKTIELYKCVEFPYNWQFTKNVFEDIVAVDTTLFFYNEIWWMFTSIDETKKSSNHDELFIFYTNDPINGSWLPHTQNPVISDAKIARPAGNIFIKEGRIFRPSQNCTGIYGSSININEILTLTIDKYEEKLLSNLKPNWDNELVGIHSLNFSDKSIVLDGFKKTFKYF